MDEPGSLDATRTPPEYFAELNKTYRFVQDLFASKENHLCGYFYTKEIDALKQEWPRLLGEGWSFGNPMYSRGNIEPAVKKAIEQARKGSGVVYLIPATTGTAWFNDLILRPCDVLDGYTVDNPTFSGYCLNMSGIGYRQKVTFLKGRTPFLPPLGWDETKPWNPPATDSVICEWQPPLR